MAAKIISERKVNTLILVHRQQLLEQWQERLMTFLGLDKKQIGVVKAGRFRLTNNLDIAMMQSIIKQGEVSEILENYGQIIVDECHHVSAFSFEKILKYAKAKYVMGLTATPYRKDGRQPIIFMQCGPIRYQTTGHKDKNDFLLTVEAHHTSFEAIGENINSLYQLLVEDEARNQLILNDIINAYSRGRYPLVLTERKQHLEWFNTKLHERGIKNVFMLQGGMKKKDLDAASLELKNAKQNRIILATGRFAGEGFDDPKLDTLFLTLPISWHGTLQQYVGRLHRNLGVKTEIIVHDYVDSQSPVLLRMYRKRYKKYYLMGYVVNDKL